MLPASIVWLKALPLNAGGKIDRRALPTVAEPGAPSAGVRVAPRDMFEQVLVGIWERLLDVDGIGVFDHFFDLGGHSLLAARLMDEIERETGLTAPLAAFFAEDTIAGLARLLRECPTDLAVPVVTINGGGTRPPLVFLHGDLSGGGFYSRSLAHALGSDQPMLVVQPHTLDDSAIPDTVEGMAADRIRALRAIRRAVRMLRGYGTVRRRLRDGAATDRGGRRCDRVAIQARAPRALAGRQLRGEVRLFDRGDIAPSRSMTGRARLNSLDLQAMDRTRAARTTGRLARPFARAGTCARPRLVRLRQGGIHEFRRAEALVNRLRRALEQVIVADGERRRHAVRPGAEWPSSGTAPEERTPHAIARASARLSCYGERAWIYEMSIQVACLVAPVISTRRRQRLQTGLRAIKRRQPSRLTSRDRSAILER